MTGSSSDALQQGEKATVNSYEKNDWLGVVDASREKTVRAQLCTHSKISPELYTLNSQPRYPVDVFNVQLVQSLLKCTQGTHCHVGHLKYKDTKYI